MAVLIMNLILPEERRLTAQFGPDIVTYLLHTR
jgi:hypothetical protein